MDDKVKIYDTVRGNHQLLYYNSVPTNGYNTTNCSKLKKSNHWTNIFTWKKKQKQSPNSIINYPFVAPVAAMPAMIASSHRYGGSMSAATGIAYTFAPPPGRLSAHDMRQDFVTSTTTTTTTIHASIKSHTPTQHLSPHRNSLFYTPWESFHDQSAQHLSGECTCHPTVDYSPVSANQRSVTGLQSAKSVPMIAPAAPTEPIYESRRLSRMDLYSLDEETNVAPVGDKDMDFKSKSSDSLLDIKKKNRPPNGIKSCKSSTTLNGNPYEYKTPNHKKGSTSATVNERFLRIFKKSATDPYNSVASRKSILECEVSAYDLIQRRLQRQLFLEEEVDDIIDADDDSLSDNAIENETMIDGVAINKKSAFIESNGADVTKHSLTANSLRIGGYGMNLASLPASVPKLNSNCNIYSTLGSSTGSTPSNSSWSAGSGDDTVMVPEPDYDNTDDDNDYDDSYGGSGLSSANFPHLKLSYSPPLATKRLNCSNNSNKSALIMNTNGNDNEKDNTSDNTSLYEKSIAKQSTDVKQYSTKTTGVESDAKQIGSPYEPSITNTEPPSPPPLPEPQNPIKALNPIVKSVLKASSLAPIAVNNFHNELKDKLNSGVKSILKKTSTPLNASPLSRVDQSLSKSESDITKPLSISSTSGGGESSSTAESCDYLKTFKEFKESRLRNGRQHRKHVHFKSLSHDRLLIIDQISAETILEVEECDEPIYDDVQLPGAAHHNSSDSNSNNNNDNNVSNCGQQTLNETNGSQSMANECHKSEQLNASTIISDTNSRIIKSVTNDNCLDDNQMGTTTTGAAVAPVLDFYEFDPSENTAPSLATRAQLAAQLAAQTQRVKHIDLNPKPDNNSNNNSIIYSSNKNRKNSNNNCKPVSDAVNQELRGAVGPIKQTLPVPTISTTTTTGVSAGGVREISSNAQQLLRVPIVERKYLPPVIRQPSPGAAPVAKPRDDRKQQPQKQTIPLPSTQTSPKRSAPQQSMPLSGRTSAPVAAVSRSPPQAQARAHKSSPTKSLTDQSNPSVNVRPIRASIGDQKVTDRQTLVPVSQEKCIQNHIQTHNHSNYKQKVLSDTNVVRLEKQTNTKNSCHNNHLNSNHNNNNNSIDMNNTEIEILSFNQLSKTLTTNQSTSDDNSGGNSGLYLNSCEGIKSAKSMPEIDGNDDQCSQYTTSGNSNRQMNPFLCTISITNGSNNKIINQTNIETNVCNTLTPFESIGSSNSSSSLYDSGAQSSTDSLNTESTLKKSLSQSPITVFYSDPNDKIVINVSSDGPFESLEEHIYEELDNESIYVDTDSSLDNAKSIFDGASKDEILEFLEDAKERVGEDILVDVTNIDANIEILEAIDVIEDIEENPIMNTKHMETSLSSNRRNRTSNVSNSSTESTATTSSSIDIEDDIMKCAISNSVSVGQLVERNDSGVGAETSKPSRLRKLSLNDEVEHQCADCEMHVDPNEDDVSGLLHYPLFCHRCDKKRSERKEIISEIVDTEFKYGRDLRIIREEFYRPIEIAGLLSKEQLRGVFLNLDELIQVNSKFSEKLQDAIDIATEQGDEDFTTVNIGKLFRDSSSMLHSFEVYCVRQGSAALLLNHLEKEKELLRIFLRVSQMENTLLRRMNLRSFLVVPVQRVTKYPLLLNRLYKVTPYHHRDREALRESQQKVELHLEHINQQTKGTIGATTRIWRRISNLSTSHRRLNSADDIGNIKLRKAALEILKWNQEETQFVIIGKVFFTSITDYTVNRKAKTLKFLTASALLVTLGRPNQNYRPDLVNRSDTEKDMVFPRDNTGITDSVLLLIKEKLGRYALCKEIMNLKSSVVSCESESDEMFEIHEQTTKESLLFKGETLSETKDWLKQLKYHSKDLGNWRRRRHALANIMMVRQ